MRRFAISFFLVAIAVPAHAQKVPDLGAGWTLRDVGSKPGDDSEREVSIVKDVPHLKFSYSPTETNSGGSFTIHFDDFPKCSPLSFSSGFGFDDPPTDRAREVRTHIHDAFVDYAKECKTVGMTETVLMDGFGPAFAAVEKLINDKPYVYPADDAETPPAADTKSKGRLK